MTWVKKPRVNVFVDSQRVGSIDRSDVEEDTFLFDYEKDVESRLAVSLTMPPRTDQYDSTSGLLPIFEMNLPEGGLKERLRNQFAKAVPGFDDLDMLAIVGSSQIGRLRYAHEEVIKEDVPAQDLKEILTYRGSEDFFAELLERFATYSGISGVQPKVLVRSQEHPMKFAHRGSTHIIKSFDSAEFPELAANEVICTAGALRAGLPTSKVTLSENRKLLIVDRFDRLSNGTYLGIEDFCVLTARRAHGRYDSSYEEIAKRIGDFVSPAKLGSAREQFALMVSYACAIENGDAHLKNFSVLYENPDSSVSLAPAYDLVSTTPYFARDTLALTIAGSKNFPTRASLLKFIRETTSKNEKAAAQVIEQAVAGAEAARAEALVYARRNPDASPFSEKLNACISRGISRLTAD